MADVELNVTDVLLEDGRLRFECLSKVVVYAFCMSYCLSHYIKLRRHTEMLFLHLLGPPVMCRLLCVRVVIGLVRDWRRYIYVSGDDLKHSSISLQMSDVPTSTWHFQLGILLCQIKQKSAVVHSSGRLEIANKFVHCRYNDMYCFSYRRLFQNWKGKNKQRGLWTAEPAWLSWKKWSWWSAGLLTAYGELSFWSASLRAEHTWHV